MGRLLPLAFVFGTACAAGHYAILPVWAAMLGAGFAWIALCAFAIGDTDDD
jgi:hypothetical protein